MDELPLEIMRPDFYNAVNQYSSDSWKERAADTPARQLVASGHRETFVYRFDWDDLPVIQGVDFGVLAGAAHALEILFLFPAAFDNFVIKNIVIKDSYDGAKKLSEQGAELAFTYLGVTLKKRVVPLAESLKSNFVLDCNVEKKEDVARTFEDIKNKWENLDFVVHAIAFSDRSELSGEYINTSRENFLKSMLISCFSFTEVAKEASKIMSKGSSMLTLTYESSKVFPNYIVMGVCKAALESSVKYLARDLGSKGIRVNAISAGPIKTLAASAIGDAKFLYKWNEDHSLLKRNVDINDIGGSALYLLSDLAAAVTGEIHYVDAGYNKVGMPNPKNIT